MAPIAVPLLMLLGVSPEMTTAAYRMGDSIFNIVTPVASNFVLVLVMCLFLSMCGRPCETSGQEQYDGNNERWYSFT
jgi:hypothetical protein